MLLWGDVCNHYVASLQKPDWHVVFDMDKDAAVASRKKILGMVAAVPDRRIDLARDVADDPAPLEEDEELVAGADGEDREALEAFRTGAPYPR